MHLYLENLLHRDPCGIPPCIPRGSVLFLENLISIDKKSNAVALFLDVLIPPPGFGKVFETEADSRPEVEAFANIGKHESAGVFVEGASSSIKRQMSVDEPVREMGNSNAAVERGMVACQCVESWVAQLQMFDTPFARYATKCVHDQLDGMGGRHRDLLPLPVPHLCDIPWQPDTGKKECDAMLSLMRFTTAGLNWLSAGGHGCRVPKRSTVLHRAVFRTMHLKCRCLFELLGEDDVLLNPKDAFNRFTLGNLSADFPDLDATKVDLLDTSGGVDPLDFVSAEDVETLTCLKRLFPTDLNRAPKAASVRGAARREYVLLTVRELRARKLDLHTNIHAAASSFVVGKKSKDRQREVWNGSIISSLAKSAPTPPALANPTALGELTASDDRPIVASCRDAAVFFDQLRSPLEIRSMLGKAPVRVSELTDPELGDFSMNLDEVRSCCAPGVQIDSQSQVFPRCATMPMGFSWSSFLAQSVMLGCLQEANIQADQLLTQEGNLVRADAPSFSVATDDIFCFEREGLFDKNDQRSAPMAAVDEVLAKKGIQMQSDKRRDRVKNSTCLGVELRHGRWLGPRGSRVKSLLSCLMDMKVGQLMSPRQLATVTGSLTWYNLLSRALLACLHCSYGFTHAEQLDVPQKLTCRVLDELILNASLMVYWIVDLTRPWSTLLPMTDASPAYGYGLCWAQCPVDEVLTLAQQVNAWPHHVRIKKTNATQEVARAGARIDLNLGPNKFSTVFSIKAKHRDSPGAMEAKAVVLGFKRILRNKASHRKRLVFGVDAQAIMHALRKGRSSAWSIRRHIAAASASILAGDLRVKFFYVPSEDNVADKPSRGKTTRPIRSTWGKNCQRGLDKSYNRLRHQLSSLRLLDDTSDYSDLWSQRRFSVDFL